MINQNQIKDKHKNMTTAPNYTLALVENPHHYLYPKSMTIKQIVHFSQKYKVALTL